MCMACNSGKMSTKKKVISFYSAGLAIAIGAYLIFTTTKTPALAATLPALLPFAACPLMCVAVGGLMWFSRRSPISNDNHKGSHDIPMATNIKEGEASCCNQEILQHTNKNQNENLELTRTTELPSSKSNNNKNKDVV